MNNVDLLKYSIFPASGLAALTTGIFFLNSPILSTLGLITILFSSSHRLSALFHNPLKHTGTILGLLLTLSFLSISGAAIYYLHTVTAATYFWPIAALPLITYLLTKTQPQQKTTTATPPANIKTAAATALLTLSLIAFFTVLQENSTIEATRSPWLIVTPSVLLAIATATLALTTLAKNKKPHLTILATSATLLAIISIALLIFPLGFGFDPFLHQATIDHIAINGTITPKPYYYIGQYALELILIFTTNLSSHTIDTALLPILTAIILPTIAATSIFKITKRPTPTAIATIAVLLLPLSSFINTTPQGLANLWVLSIIFLALPELITKSKLTPHFVLITLSIATVLIHPLAGLPALLFTTLVILKTTPHLKKTAKTAALITMSAAGSIMLPIAFSISSPTNWNINLNNLSTLIPNTFFSTRFNAIGDIFTIITTNGWLWHTLLAITAATILLKKAKTKNWLILPLTTIILLINAIILTIAGNFSFLIDYEQTNYTSRVLLLSLFAILPLSTLGLGLATEKLWQIKSATLKIATITILTIAIPANAYTTYPTHDSYKVSRGFTIGSADHSAVASIKQDAANEPYIVLSNQAVSAAAIQDYGFTNYYGENQDIFYYPVPTGGPLYKIFIEMIEGNPAQEKAEEAMALAGVNKAYLVINKYWWSSEMATERAKLATKNWFKINNGEIWVFVYTKK